MIKTLLAVFLTIILTDCHTNVQNHSITKAQLHTNKKQNEAIKLNQLLENYFNDYLTLNPIFATFIGNNKYNDRFHNPISKKNRSKQLAFHQKYLTLLKTIDVNMLEGQNLLSYEIFKQDREMAIKSNSIETYLTPINQMRGIHNLYAILGSGQSAQPFNTAKDFINFEKRSKGFAIYMDSVIEAMREGTKKGIVLPKPIINKLIPQLEAHIVEDVTDSVFYQPIEALENNKNILEKDKKKITFSYVNMIKQVIIPAYKRTRDFVVNEYSAYARNTVGLSALPNGKAWYEHMIHVNTTLSLSAEQIHQYGLQEVARILDEMKIVKKTVGFDGDLAAFFTFLKEDKQFYFKSDEEVIAAYEGVKKNINAKVGQLFEVFPKADYEVRAVEKFRAASAAGASYQSPSPDGTRPGIFYINTHNLNAQPKFITETLSIHEASPGHHFQISIQQEVENLAKFRKFGSYTVFSEGWALYAESLGKEMGLFTDPYQWYGRLSDEQLRAMRLVVDTGLHYKGWTRKQAMDYMQNNSSLAHSDIEAEVERYIAIPGQALAYKIGQRVIQQLRTKLQHELGDKFDIKKFHTQILIDGALPMPILEAKLNRWAKISSSKYQNRSN